MDTQDMNVYKRTHGKEELTWKAQKTSSQSSGVCCELCYIIFRAFNFPLCKMREWTQLTL